MTDQQQRTDYPPTGPTGQPAASEADGPAMGQQPGPQGGGPAPASEADRPDMARQSGYQQQTFPQDERGGDFQGAPPAGPGGATAASGAPQATDPGLADQTPGGPAGETGMDRFSGRWASVQAAFVDDPKNAVGEADRLVAEAIQSLEQSLTQRREQMQSQWRGDGEPDTEQLRRLLHGYRSLFQNLVDSGL